MVWTKAGRFAYLTNQRMGGVTNERGDDQSALRLLVVSFASGLEPGVKSVEWPQPKCRGI